MRRGTAALDVVGPSWLEGGLNDSHPGLLTLNFIQQNGGENTHFPSFKSKSLHS